MSGEYTFGASDDIVRRIRENLPHIEWEQPLSAERERLAADEIVRLRTRLQACQSNDDYPLTDDCITQNERFLLDEVERLRAERDAERAEVARLIRFAQLLLAERDVETSSVVTSDTGTIGLVTTLPSNGAWFVYSTDYGYHPLALFSDDLSARRWTDEHDYGRVVFWPFGMDWKEARRG